MTGRQFSNLKNQIGIMQHDPAFELAARAAAAESWLAEAIMRIPN